MASSASGRKDNPLHIVFLHLDLGIGGAEQLVVNLALASVPREDKSKSDGNVPDADADASTVMNGKVSIFTTHCDQKHCFDVVNKTLNPPGKLANSVHVVGAFLPVTILGKGTAFCSTIRMLYLSFVAKRMYPDADVFVLDVLPTPIPYLVQRSKCVIYYCHFPDKLLTRDTVNGETSEGASVAANTSGGLKTKIKYSFKKRYRHLLDYMEEWAMSFADLICVNSNFTKTEVLGAFPSLNKPKDGYDAQMEVLYPAIDLDKFIPPDFARKQQLLDTSDRRKSPIVSLNRFERKKNIEVLLCTYASIYEEFKNDNKLASLPPLIISGGYDPRNLENVEYLKELEALAKSLHIEENTKFRPSVSDEERALLLQSAICVVYTPHREHFGIVPLEAMYAGSAVVAIKSGGPKETIVDGVTGILVDIADGKTSDNMKIAIKTLLDDPMKAIDMGKRGHDHVKEHFGLEPFRREWKRLVVDEGMPRGRLRQEHSSRRMILILSYCVLLLAWYVAKYAFIGTVEPNDRSSFAKVVGAI